MRFAIVRQYYNPDGAVERVTERALEALLERNVAVSLYTRAWPQTRLQLMEPVICNPYFVGTLWRDWGFANAACRSIRRTLPTLVEAHAPMLCCDVYLAGDGVHAVRVEEQRKHAEALERVSLACSAYGRYLRRTEARLFASPWLRAVICKSRMVRDEIRARFAVPESKLSVVYNPVDGERFHPGVRARREKTLKWLRIDAGALIFLVVCRDVEQCAYATVVDALAATPPPAHLVVVCSSQAARRIRAHAQVRGVVSRVTAADPHADLRPYFGAADVFVAPSIYDPSPDTALEAMACGLSVIASSKSGVAEMLGEHQCGLAFAATDTAALVAAMHSLADPAMRARLGENARRAALPLSPAATTLSLVLLYRDLLAASAPATGPGTTAPTA
ncbi:MAG TPA: glycosyltransferase family 4 protein [Casimicrobiaceae bacterium]|nr:glycosyltransferase family 4 protein [Casimicrobiaceae bacterium]